MQELISGSERDAVKEVSARAAYRQPTLLRLGSFASVTRMMVNGPYADGMLGLMPMQ